MSSIAAIMDVYIRDNKFNYEEKLVFFSSMAIRECNGIFLEVQDKSQCGIRLLPFIIFNSSKSTLFHKETLLHPGLEIFRKIRGLCIYFF